MQNVDNMQYVTLHSTTSEKKIRKIESMARRNFNKIDTESK